MEKIQIVLLKEEYLEDIRKIRNTDFVKNICWNNNDIIKEQQIKWFNRIQKDPDIYEFAIILNNNVVGACNLETNKSKIHAEFGIYLDKKYVGKGYGKIVMDKLCEFAWSKLELHKIWGQVFSFNKGAISFYKKNNFAFEGNLKNHIFRNGQFYDVYIVSKFKEEK